MNKRPMPSIPRFRTTVALPAARLFCLAIFALPGRASETAPPTPPAAAVAPTIVDIPQSEEGNDISIEAPGTGITVPPAVRAEQERGREREAAIRKALEDRAARPADPEPVERLVNLYIQGHEGKKALEAAVKFVASSPNNSRGLLNLGKAHYWNGDFARAALQFERASVALPADPEPRVWLARTQSITGELGRAGKTVESALALDPKSMDALLVSGRVQEGLKQFGAAGKTWERLVAAKYDAGEQDTRLLARAQMCKVLAKKQPLAVTWPEGRSVTLDMMRFQGILGVKLRLNQKVEKYFLVDFSAEDIVLTQAAATELELVGFGGSRSQNRPDLAEYAYPDSAILDTLQAGSLLMQNVPVNVNPGLRYPHPEVGGLLGRRFLSEFLATMDYPARKLTLVPVSATPIEGEPIAIGNAVTVRATYLGEEAGTWLLDTTTFTPGPVSILWAQETLGVTAMSAGVMPVLRGPYIFKFTMPQIEVGGVSWRSFKATGVDLRSLSERLGSELSGILSTSLLNDTRTTLDLAHNRVHLERVKEQTWTSPSKVAPATSPGGVKPPASASPPAPAPAAGGSGPTGPRSR